MTKRTRILSLLAVGLMALSPAFAQVPEKLPNSAPPASPETQEVMKRFAELSKKVNEQPELQKLKKEFDESRRAYFEAFNAAISKEDAEILEKMRSFHGAALPSPGKFNPFPNRLNEQEKTQLDTARKQAMETAEVQDARSKRNAAKTEEERRLLDMQYKEALREAVLKADPELTDILKKLEAPTPPKHQPAAP